MLPSASHDPRVDDPASLGAAKLAAAIRRGTWTAERVVEAHLDRIERRNPALNAVVTLAADRARAEARAADAAQARGEALGALHGVPITIKDGFATEGLRTTWGLPAYGTHSLVRHVPAQDAPTVAALRRAGAIVLGKTNLPLASYDWQTRHPWLGRTRNPHDLARTPGGSSGGSAAAVAARLVPLDLGSDACGSLRVPAHFCGVLAMRPTEGRLPTEGLFPPGYPGLAHTIVPGPLARSVADLRLALSVLDPSLPPLRPRPLVGLRAAVSETIGEAVVSASVRDALHRFADALRAAGAIVVDAGPDLDAAAALRTWGDVHGYEFVRGAPWLLHSTPLRRLAPSVFARRYGPGPWPRALGMGAAGDRSRYADGLRRRAALLDAVDAFFDTVDVWIHPVAGVPAFGHRPTGASIEVDGRAEPYSAVLGELNALTALAGTPAIAFPIEAPGLPIGLQAHARRDRDAALLDIVGSLEAAGLVVVPPPPSVPRA